MQPVRGVGGVGGMNSLFRPPKTGGVNITPHFCFPAISHHQVSAHFWGTIENLCTFLHLYHHLWWPPRHNPKFCNFSIQDKLYRPTSASTPFMTFSTSNYNCDPLQPFCILSSLRTAPPNQSKLRSLHFPSPTALFLPPAPASPLLSLIFFLPLFCQQSTASWTISCLSYTFIFSFSLLSLPSTTNTLDLPLPTESFPQAYLNSNYSSMSAFTTCPFTWNLQVG